MNLEKKFLIKSTTIFLIIFSFFLGFFLRENASGGGLEFYNLSWPIINSFKEDFFFTINNYGSFKDGSFPLAHIINAYVNPFSGNDWSLQLSITILSFVIFIIFAFTIKKSFSYIGTTDIFLTSSVILLLPFFRTSAFWGKPENFSWLFFIISLYFFNEIKKRIFEIPDKEKIFNIIFFCFFSACTLYVRQSFIFLPISYFLYLFFFKAHKKIIFLSIVFFAILALPGLYLILQWGGLYDTKNFDSYFMDFIHPKYILKNIPILLSFFGFYLLPILIIELIKDGYKNIFNKYFNIFLLFFIFLIALHFAGVLGYLGNYIVGGGAILKINYLIKQNNYFLLIIFSSIGFSIIINLLKDDLKNNGLFLLPIIIIYSFPILLHQEYAEPLVLILFFLAFNTKLHQTYFEKPGFSSIILLSYFTIFLLGSIYFKHFAFDSLEKWKNFLLQVQ
tara:strand:+ start:701 stop:2044 length:1344 start_codon:yes stop_codon:yes gene_type:complete